jgi:hypothetical protein
VGASIDDVCRACKALRVHTVMVIDGEGRALRVMCDYCRSEHNYRGGGDAPGGAPRPAAAAPRLTPRASASASAATERVGVREHAGAFPPVSERERTGPVTNASESGADLELVLRRVIREELGLTPVVPADKWRGGELVLRPGKPGLQEKRWPIETFFHKVVMIRNRLRTLEQQVNAAELPEDAKVRLQAYISGCYGSLTSFNLLFADEEDQFKGAGGE